jgi:hypothetical protein
MTDLRNWSFTRLWVAITLAWLLALVAGSYRISSPVIGAFAIGLALAPAFLAGAWAGEHQEIEAWPRIRLVAMWALAGAAFLGINETFALGWLPGAVACAPIGILTIRWIELRDSPTLLPAPATAPTDQAIATQETSPPIPE